SSATAIGWVAFCVFAIASLAQVVVGLALDRVGPRRVFLVLSVIQLSAFLVMPGSANWMAIAAALVFMVATFGQIPICDYMIGRLAAPKRRAQIYGARFAVVFIVLAATLPLVSWMHANFGFDVMFYALGVAAVMLLATAALLPAKLPNPSELAKA
ncbi:MAG: MFS transporter, partial [Pseudomonadota bacterium]